MRHFIMMFLPVLALAATWASPVDTRAASGITDDGRFFSANGIRQAEDVIRRNVGHHHSDIRVITVPSIPDDMKDEFASQGKSPFFEHWANDLFKRDRVDGVLILICRNPSHLQVEIGDETREKVFQDADRRELISKLTTAFKATQYDQGLLDAVRFIQVRENANIGHTAPTAVLPGSNAPITTPMSPGQPFSNTPAPGAHLISGSGWVCLGVGVLIVAFLIIGAINRSRNNYGGGYGAPPPGGYPPGSYPPGYSGGYPQGGGYYGGGNTGGGFGRGFLGGLLGGAVGAWGYDKLTGRENPNPNYIPGSTPGSTFGPAQTDPSDQPDSTSSGSGADFGDNSNSSGGADFGGNSSGGADFGGSSDSGGGSDFGGSSDSGGGGDFGGGDSGSSGGDF